jgi:branched-chain amino acid aminotransferase
MIDGEVVPLERATVSVLDRGFLYGDAVFETLRSYDGRPFLLDRHLERLARSAATVGIPLPLPTTALEREVRSTLEAAGNADAYVRVTLTRGAGPPGLDPSRATQVRRIVLVMPLEPAANVSAEGVAAVTFATGRLASLSPTRGAKTGNYLESIMAVRYARERGASDALLVDAEGRIIQGASSNVFFVRGSRLLTPPLEAGILPGIIRGVVLEIAAALAVPVELRAPLTLELGDFSEIFLTSSVRELAPVTRVDGVGVGTGRPGPVYGKLHAEFVKRAGSD